MTTRELMARTFVLILMLVLVLPAALPPLGASPIDEADPWVIDPYLREEVLGTVPPNEEIEVIAQFKDGITPEDVELVEREGFQVLHRYSIVPGLWLKGPARLVERLSGYHRVSWIEYNDELEWMMDETTAIVNATRTWYSKVEGSLWGTQGLDGKGVTVVVIDSGIDAGHPDLDYGTKTIRNLKSDTGTGPWYEVENGDTSSGHGTHVAGTVAGNGDASSGARAGVAPGANLIGLSVGEAVFVTGGLGALEWTYEHSRPGNNPYNIRVATNSWGGGGGQYDPQDSISQAINALVYENNVAVSFAAGNSGGDGNTIQASNYGNTPAAIGVAAAGRDGTYITDFSSKGQWDWVDTWPDLAAPGHNIQSTAARRTLISLLQRGTDANPYYFPISGTSMATPHVAGALAILFQAAPSLRVSEVVEDVGIVQVVDGEYQVVEPEEGSYGNLPYDYQEWLESAPDTRVHEAELILELTATRIPPQGEGDPGANNLTDNYVPSWSVPGFSAGRDYDFSQGYGLINVHRAVGLALTLERIRWDHPRATVFDAYQVFEDIFEVKDVSASTDQLTTRWGSEWSRFNDQLNKPVFTSNLTKFVHVPDGATEVTVSMQYRPVDATKLTAGALGFQIDYDNSGDWDYSSGVGLDLDGSRTVTIPVSGTSGQSWKFGVYGFGFKLPRPTKQNQFEEARMEVDMSVSIKFESAQGTIMVNETDLHSINGHLRLMAESPDYTAGNVSVRMDIYNISRIEYSPPVEPPIVPDDQGLSWWWLLVLILALIVVAYIVAKFSPESRAGRLVLRTGTAVGAVQAYQWTKARARSVVGLVRAPPRKPRVVKAEVVEEET